MANRHMRRCSTLLIIQFSSVQFSRSVVSDSLRPHESQHARPPCPSPSPRVHSDSGPSSLWCHPAISSSVVPFSSCPQSLPASELHNYIYSSYINYVSFTHPPPFKKKSLYWDTKCTLQWFLSIFGVSALFLHFSSFLGLMVFWQANCISWSYNTEKHFWAN